MSPLLMIGYALAFFAAVIIIAAALAIPVVIIRAAFPAGYTLPKNDE